MISTEKCFENWENFPNSNLCASQNNSGLDFVTGIAVGAKDLVGQPEQSTKFAANRLRPPRVTLNVHGTLPVFSTQLAAGQEVLRSISANAKEKMWGFMGKLIFWWKSIFLMKFRCMAMHMVNETSGGENLHVLVSNKKVYFVKKRRFDDYEVQKNNYFLPKNIFLFQNFHPRLYWKPNMANSPPVRRWIIDLLDRIRTRQEWKLWSLQPAWVHLQPVLENRLLNAQASIWLKRRV